MAGENVGKAYVEIRADGTHLERDIKDILDRISATHQLNLKVNLDLNLDKIKADLDKLGAEHPVKLTASIDLAPVRADIDKLRAEAEANPVKIRTEADTSKATEDIKRVAEDTKTAPVKVSTEADTTTLASSITKAVESINNSPASKPLIKPAVDAKKVESDVSGFNLKAVLNLLPKLPGNVKAGLTGLAYSITGAIPLASYVEVFADLGKNFETMGLKMTALTARYGTYATAATDAAMATLSLGGDLYNLIGFAALGPAVFTAYASGMIVLKDSFSKFSAALGGSKQALASFPPDVQKLIEQLSQLNKDFKQPIQSAFWMTAKDSLLKVAKEDLPVVRAAFTQEAKQFGKIFDELLAGFDRWVKGGGFKTTFDNINQGWANAAKGIGPFSDALNTLTTVGSQFFPAFGNAAADAANKFKTFIDNAAKTGNITAWIVSAKDTFKQVWDLGGNLISIFQSLTDAANKAGAGGLKLLGDSVAKVADGLKSVRAQQGLTTFFTEVHTGAVDLVDGFNTLLGVLGKASSGIGDVLHAAGSAGGEILKALSGAFDGTRLTSGVTDALNGLRDIAETLKPAFHDLGNIIGDLGTMAGTMIQSTISGIARMVGTVSEIIGNLRDGFVAVIPIFNNFMQGFIDVAAGPIIQFSKVIGDLLKAFAALPAPMQNMLMVLALIGFSLSKVIPWFKDFQEKVSKAFKGVRDDSDETGKKIDKDLDKQSTLQKSIGGFKGFASSVKTSLTEAGDTISNKMVPAWGKVGTAAHDAASTMVREFKGAVSDITLGAGMLANDVHTGFVKMGEGIGTALAPAKAAFKNAMKDLGDGFSELGAAGKQRITESLSTIGDGAAKFFSPITNAAQKMKDTVVASFVDLGQNVKDSTEEIPTHVRADFQDVVNEVQSTRGSISKSAVGMWDGIKTNAAEMADSVKIKMGAVKTSIMESVPVAAVTEAFGRVSAVATTTADSIMTRFLVVKGTLSDLGSSIGGAVKTTAGGIGEIAASGAKVAGSGLKSALGGVMDMMGGPWGVAIAGATTVLELYANEQAKASQNVQDFAGTLDKTTGAITNATKAMIPQKGLDGITNDWDNFYRGVLQDSKSTSETLQTLGISTQEYTNRLADPKGRDAFVKGINDVSDALLMGQPVTEDMAKAIGTTTDALQNINSDSVHHLGLKAGEAATALDKAQQATKELAEATGTTTTQAAILQKNFDTLSSSTSTASDKFSAFKENLQLIIDSQDKVSKTTKNAQRDFAQSNLDLTKSFKAVKEENDGLIANLYDVKGGFDFTKQAGIDLSKTLDNQRDSILKLGTDALQQAMNNGKTGTEAQKAALDAMTPAIGSLEKQLQGLGFGKEQIDGIIQSLGLMPKDLTTAIGVKGGDEARSEIIRTQIAGQAFASGNWTAVLAALPDKAKAAIEEQTGLAGAFASGNYQAILGALDATKGGKEAALASILGVTDGNYEAKVKALDITNITGIPDARVNLGNITSFPWVATLKAAYDATHDPAIEATLNYLTRPRTIAVTTTYTDSGTPVVDNASGLGHVSRPTATSANGNIFLGNAIPKFFANGGFEDHIAQIAQPGIVPRVWAEAETGGEAYIPLSLGKRTRSTQILEQVAEMFGYTLAKKLSFFDGGILTSVPRQSALSASVSSSSASQRTAPPAFAGTGASVNVNVYPSQGLSEEQIGRSAATELFWQLMTRPGMSRA